ncbi:MAG: hypothetical protein OHK0013_05560 [Sandaracinaceae bacterium]
MNDAAVTQKPTPARRAFPWRGVAIVSGVAIVALLAGLFFSRSAILTFLVTNDLDRRGVHCEGLSLEASPTLDEVVIAPAFCAVGAGAVAEVRWDVPMRAMVEGTGVATLSVSTLRVTRRPSGGDARARDLGAIGDLVRAPERLGGVLHFAARLSERASPRLEAATIEVLREGDPSPELTLREVVIPAREAGSPVEATIAEIALAPVGGPLGVRVAPRMTEVSVRAEPTRGSLEGSLDPSVRLPVLGALTLGGLVGPRRVAITVDALDTGNPRWNVEAR